MDMISKLEAEKQRLAREAKKWLGYLLAGCKPEDREKELTRLLMTTWLEGRASQ